MTGTFDFKATAGVLALALAIGGAGLNYPLLQSALIITALALAASWIFSAPVGAPPPLSRALVVILAASFALPLLQLVPLPPTIWQVLPGRGQPAALDEVIGWSVWRPWTLDVEATIRALIVMIPGAVILLACLRLGSGERARLLWLVVGFAVLSALLGMLQVASGGRFTPFPSSHSDYPIGLFVNRNHQAVFLLAAMPLAAALGANRMGKGSNPAAITAITLSIVAILAATIVATTSRMAFVLLPFMLIASMAIFFLGRSKVRLVVPSMLALGGVAAVIWVGGGFAKALNRLSSTSDARFDYWSDVSWALDNYGVAGTGIGTFIPVHKSAESLDTITPAILNHAHNDYIELLLEGGIPAALLILVFFALLLTAVIRSFRSNDGREQTNIVFAAISALTAILVFSLVDYPLRMPSIEALFALLVTLLLPSRRKSRDVDVGSKNRNAAWRWGLLFPLGVLGILTVQAGVSARQLSTGQIEYAAQWAPWSTVAHSRLASRMLFVDRRPDSAKEMALDALRLSPLDAPSIRTLAIVRGFEGSPSASARLMEMSATLGWRDPVINIWAIEAARRSGDHVKAVQRAEAQYRQGHFVAASTNSLFEPPIGQHSADILAQNLARRPPWRRSFLRSLDQASVEALPAITDLIVTLNRSGSQVSLDEIGPLMDHLKRLKDNHRRQRLWLELHPQLIANGGFEDTSSFRGPELPQYWDISSEELSSLSVDSEESGKGRSLRLARPRAAVPLIAQQMMLRPGSYQLTFAIRGSDPSGSIWRWELRCEESGVNHNHDVALRHAQRWQTLSVDLSIPDQNCRNQTISFQRLGGLTSGPVWLDNITLKHKD